MMRLCQTLAIATLLLLASAGCRTGSRLETGYAYRPLNASPQQQRGYYAGPFSPEARAAQRQGLEQAETRRPRPGM